MGFLTAMSAGSVFDYRRAPGVYPGWRTGLDARTYRVVGFGLAVGVVVGGVGAVLSLADTVGALRAVQGQEAGLLAGLAILLPAWLETWMVWAGVGSLVGAAVFAAVVEVQQSVK